MNMLMLKVKEDAKKKSIKNIFIASKLKVSPGTISNYYSGRYRIGGQKFAELISVVYSDENKKVDHLILEYAKKAEKDEFIIELLEWCHHSGKKSLQKEILKYHKKSENPFFLYYWLFSKRREQIVSPNSFYMELESIKHRSNNTPEFKTLGLIGLLYAYYDLQNFNMFFLTDEALKEIEGIGNEYLKEAFQIRVYEAQAVGLFKSNNMVGANETANKILSLVNIEQYPIAHSSSLILMSEIYVFENYQKSLRYIKKAMKLFIEVSDTLNITTKKQLEATHDFIKIENKDFNNLYLTDPEEEAHFLAMIGGENNTRKSLEILEEIEKANGQLDAFQSYYKALALKDDALMSEVKEMFINNGDKFYVNLPKRYLKGRKLI